MAWKLVPPTVSYRYPIAGALTFGVTTPLTVYGDDVSLHTSIDGDDAGAIETAKYAWFGGHENTTTDSAIRDLWVNNGFTVVTG